MQCFFQEYICFKGSHTKIMIAFEKRQPVMAKNNSDHQKNQKVPPLVFFLIIIL